jgi:putative phage-type endonuclease
MGFVELEQGSDEWLSWRMSGIGSSDAPIIAGHNPFKSVHQLFNEKLGQMDFFEGNFATKRGNEREPLAREIYQQRYGIRMLPCTYQRDDIEWARASTDGYSIEEKIAIEIKSPLKKQSLVEAKEGLIPKIYYAQLQWIMFVMKIGRVDFVTFDGIADIYVNEVEADSHFQYLLYSKAEIFWNHVKDKKEIEADLGEPLACPEFVIDQYAKPKKKEKKSAKRQKKPVQKKGRSKKANANNHPQKSN